MYNTSHWRRKPSVQSKTKYCNKKKMFLKYVTTEHRWVSGKTDPEQPTERHVVQHILWLPLGIQAKKEEVGSQEIRLLSESPSCQQPQRGADPAKLTCKYSGHRQLSTSKNFKTVTSTCLLRTGQQTSLKQPRPPEKQPWGLTMSTECANTWESTQLTPTMVTLRMLLGRVQLFATPWTSLPGSSVHGSSLARIVEWVVISFSRESSWPRDRMGISYISCIEKWILYHLPLCHLGSPTVTPDVVNLRESGKSM